MAYKAIKVHPLPPIAAGMEYRREVYPEEGLYFNSGILYLVIGSSVFALTLGTSNLPTVEVPDIAPSCPPGISETTLLKAIAISQQPGLAETLCR